MATSQPQSSDGLDDTLANMAHDRDGRTVAFEVLRNTGRVCVAGLRGRRGVVSIIVHWTDRDDELMLEVGGLDAEARESITWAKKPLSIGDELVIRVIGDAATTRARSRKKLVEQLEAKHEQAWLRVTAKKYGFKLVRGAHPHKSR
jgi:hypothetical protein